jgi:hypothetical protein
VDLDTALLPVFAPLSAPLVDHLIAQRLTAQTPLQAVAELRAAVAGARHAVYDELDTVVRADRLTIQRFRAFLSAVSPPGSVPSDQTFALWRARGLLRMRRRRFPDAQSTAAILVARQVTPHERQRGWLPAEMVPSEPMWWCWRQDAPDTAIVPCPVPLPADVPHGALVWSNWRGATWLPAWSAVVGGAVYIVPEWPREAVLQPFDTWALPLDPAIRTALGELTDGTVRTQLARQLWTDLVTPVVETRVQQIRTPLDNASHNR